MRRNSLIRWKKFSTRWRHLYISASWGMGVVRSALAGMTASAPRSFSVARKALQLGDKAAAANDSLMDEYPTRPPHPRRKAALSPEQEGAIALIDRRKTLLRRANNLLAKGHDQGDGSIDLMLGQLLPREDVVLGVAVADDVGEAPRQYRVTIV